MHIGLIGGIGVAATLVYYQRLTAAVTAIGGEPHRVTRGFDAAQVFGDVGEAPPTDLHDVERVVGAAVGGDTAVEGREDRRHRRLVGDRHEGDHGVGPGPPTRRGRQALGSGDAVGEGRRQVVAQIRVGEGHGLEPGRSDGAGGDDR